MTSFTGARWAGLSAPSALVDTLTARGLSAVAARCAAIRWPDEPALGEGDWLSPSLDHLHDPLEMAGMEAALDRLRRAARDGQRVRIITDYDVDGTTSSLILQAALRIVAPDLAIDYHIPHRFREGYGFSVVAAQQAVDDGIGLVVTADIGVRDHAAVSLAREHGTDVLICDHHLPRGAAVPEDALVLCPPQRGCTYPNPHLAACGISLKVAQALLQKDPRRERILRSMLKLAAVGTVADLVPLTSLENRAIVAIGLEELNGASHHAGLAALLRAAGLTDRPVQASDLGFRLGPRINAAGRIDDARLVVDLLNSRDPEESARLAERLERHNQHRRDIQEQLVAAAVKQLGDPPDPFVVVAGPEEEGWHRGVVGIVASRVKELVNRPAAVVSVQGEQAVGSVRSIDAVHAVEALESVSDLLVKFGGHPMAAGFTVRTADIPALRERLSAWVSDRLTPDDLLPVRSIDAEVPADALDLALHDELEALGPFGKGNPRPRLLLRAVQPRDVRLLGEAQRMLKFSLPVRSGAIDAIWWDRPEHAGRFAEAPVDLLGTLTADEWRGVRRLQFKVSDARDPG